MTFTRLTRTVALVLVALVAFSGAADAKRKKKRKPARAVATLPAEGRNLHQSAISVVLAAGVMPGETAKTMRPDDPLDGPALQAFVQAAFPKTGKRVRQIAAGQTVTMGDVNAIFVEAAGMGATAARAEELIANAGYVVRPGLGTEIVARLMRLRTNLDQAEDAKEHAWYEQASRGDAIWSTAVVLQWGGWEKQSAIDTVELLAQVPQTTGPQHDAIQRAFDFIGMPYIWGGTSEQPQILFGANTAGGFDCSGFTWRVLALDPTAPKQAAKNFGGRTTFEMARTAKPEQRLAREAVLPADILLFGPGGLTAASGGINHTGMAISSQLFIQSSGQGVALARWDSGYYLDRFAFGKRIL
ncbi:MAG: C40 family peptidase [Actinomycetota bacterium]